MAIDSHRKRASVASLGLAFLGASVVPDGSFVQGDRQTIGHGYYALPSAAAAKTIGGTTQLSGTFDSTGTLQVGRVIGATSQVAGSFDSTGTLQVGRVIGATTQITGAFDSSGTIQVGEVAAEAVQPTGGWVTGWKDYKTHKDEAEKRRERIAMGIIPDDMPKESAAKVIEAAESPLRPMAEKRLAELADERDEVTALRDTLAALLDAYEQDRQQQLNEMIDQMQQRRDALSLELLDAERKQNNASAALVMLALLE